MPKNTKSKNIRHEGQSTAFSSLTPRSIFNLFLERWWIGLLVGTAAAAAFILGQPKLEINYKTEVKMLFDKKERVLNVQEVVDTSTSQLDINHHLEQMASTTFYEYFASSFTPKEVEQIQNAYRDPEHPENPPPQLAAIIRPNVQFNNKRGTAIIVVTVYNRDPEAAALIANRFAQKYIYFTLDRATSGTNSAILFLKNQSEEKRIEVEAAERAMQEYRAKHNMASLGENKSVVQEKVSSIGSSLVQNQLEQSSLRTLIETVEDFQKTGKDIFELSAIASYGSVTELKNQIEGLKAERIQLSERYLDEWPRMKENAIATETAQRRLKENIALAIAELRTRYAFAQQREQRLRQDLTEAEKQAREFDRIAIDYKFLEQEAATKRSAYNMVNDRLNEASIVSQLENVNIKIMDRAYVPTYPETGTPRQVAVGAALIGCLLFIGIPLGIGFMDTRIKSQHDIESGVSQVMLGGIKTMKRLSETERPNVFRLGKDDALSEAYRGIFSEIEIRSIVSFPKRILVTSSVPSEGKSLTASNLAAVFAAHGRKTLLVDCDFRRPTLRRYFGAPGGIGLLPWLREYGQNPNVTIDSKQLGISNIGAGLDLLPAGDAIKNPTEVIDQIAACDLFNKLSKIYDLVIIDTPPSSVFPDALLLSRFCSELIYVCRFKTVRRTLLRKSLSKFTESGITTLGVVLNCVPSSSLLNYGYDGYGAYKADYYKSYQSEKVASVAK
ncbi:MAG: polysaccharide biosynthesis tyrosine autokinase [Nibricoccus sp.]